MSLNPILLGIWAALALAFFGLLIYRGQLTRYEDEQLFIGDGAVEQSRVKQSALVSKVARLQPIVRAVGGAAGLATACALGVYVWNAWQTIQ